MTAGKRDDSATREPLDAFLRDLEQLAERPLEGLVTLASALPEVTPGADLRARLLASAVTKGRFARFAERVSAMLDVSLEKAKAILDQIDDPSGWSEELPGISFLWVDGGPAVAGAVRGFLRVDAGVSFPSHEHFGDERVLILQGSYQDSVSGLIVNPGDEPFMDAGSRHGFVVAPNGPALLKLAVVDKGLDVQGQKYTPR